MAVDAGIYGQVQQPQQVNPLASLAQAYQIKAYAGAADKSDREAEQQNRLLALVQSPGFAAQSTAQKAAALQGVGAFDQASKVVTTEATANKDQRAADVSSFDLQSKKLDMLSNLAGSVTDQPSYDRARQIAQQQGLDVSKWNPQYDPAGVAQFAQATLSAKERLNAQIQQQGQQITRQNSIDSNATSRANNADTIANSAQTAQMTDARAREFNATKVDENKLKREQKQETADMTKAGQVASFDTMLGTLDRLGQHPGLTKSVGLRGKLPTIPGSDSANFQAELDTFQSQAFVPMVAQLKGMGALSDAEGRKLTQAVGALNPNMGEQAFRESIKRIQDDMESARKRVVGAKGDAAPAKAAAPDLSSLEAELKRRGLLK